MVTTRERNNVFVIVLLYSLVLTLQVKLVESIQQVLKQNGFDYVTSSDVSAFLDLAYDLEDLQQLLLKPDSGTSTRILDIYSNGRHSFLKTQDDMVFKLSLAQLSLDSESSMSKDILYNVYRHAFYHLGKDAENDIPGNFDAFPVEHYGDTLVKDLFDLDSHRCGIIAPLIINVWMAIAHEFQKIEQECRRVHYFAKLDDDDNNDNGNTSHQTGMNRALDKAVALWIGANQKRGDSNSGSMLYHLAEEAGKLFEKSAASSDDEETWVNSQFMDIVHEIQRNIQEDVCANNDETEEGYHHMRFLTKQAIKYMTIPLVQMLIHHIVQVGHHEDGADMVELYTLALLPRVAACNPNVYDEMLSLMVFNSLRAVNDERTVALQYVRQMYRCFDITCDDIGIYGAMYECQDDTNTPTSTTTNPNTTKIPHSKLAGYTPKTDVEIKAFIDRDILLIRILMFYKAYDAAYDVYKFGSGNSDYTLYQLATNQVSLHPSQQFNSFHSYYKQQQQTLNDAADNDMYYVADDIITKVLHILPPYDALSLSREQRTEIVIGLLQSVVMYLSTVSELESAITECQQQQINGVADGGSVGATYSRHLEAWDGGAAFYIGSIEGTQIVTSKVVTFQLSRKYNRDGQLLYSLANTFCSSFGTCDTNTVNKSTFSSNLPLDNSVNAEVNNVILRGLTLGSEALFGGDCEEASRVFHKSIKPALYIPLIQGTLLYAQQCDDEANDTSLEESQCFGSLHAFSRSLLPILHEVSPENAKVLNELTTTLFTDHQEEESNSKDEFNGGEGQQESPSSSSIVDFLRSALSDITIVDCKDIGSLGEEGNDGDKSEKGELCT